ncbi:MAG TPA: thioredoxin domain-containing protein [Thermoanaerobaculia bacterium]|nr:thioredoxin domain-containing protein [Thermoanaerobaculia bacterium]
MKRIAILCAAFLAASSTLSADPLDAKTEQLVRQSLPVCADLKLSAEPLGRKLPDGLTALVVRSESPRHACAGQYLAITSRAGGFYLGSPWFLDAGGATLEEKLTNFTWTRLKSNFTPVIDRQKTPEGLYRVTLIETTERGKVPMEGEVDPDGTIFFLGHFRRANADAGAARMKVFESYLSSSPRLGAEKPAVTIVEFSDFQCPSCKFAAGFVDPILEKHGDRVQYIRYDLPLGGHPWAFPASVAGRAIHRQKPDLFWEYKNQIYSNQDKLSVFTIDDFARGFASDNDLDMQRYDADVVSEQIRGSILSGVGTAFSNEIRSTPTYMVNGAFVDAGDGGRDLVAYVEKALK